MLIFVNKQSPIGMSKQISTQLLSGVFSGELKHGDILPSTCMLASQIGVSHPTVLRAYKALIRLGLIFYTYDKQYVITKNARAMHRK